MAFETLDVIYDGQCGFCARSLRTVRAFDLYRTLRFHDSHQPETFERFPALQGAKTDEAMYVLAEGEPSYSGFFAFRRLVWINPLVWILIPIFYFPGASFFGSRVYAWIARNRTSFGCRSDFCDLPSPPVT
jgi:predicted DCC family thiol-disulfide oxidoreductase YuxK